jgi:hypothetical protein
MVAEVRQDRMGTRGASASEGSEPGIAATNSRPAKFLF